MRNYVIPVVALLLLIGSGLFETYSLERNVDQCTAVIETVIEKTDDRTAKPDDVIAFGKVWDQCRDKLHAFIPHTEIRDVDVWISEAKSYIATEEFEMARAKLVVVRDKIKAIPDSFAPTFGNIF